MSHLTCISHNPQVSAFLKPPMLGVVLQTYGSGNAPNNRDDLISEIKNATRRGVLIINCTQCLHGPVVDQYATGKVRVIHINVYWYTTMVFLTSIWKAALFFVFLGFLLVRLSLWNKLRFFHAKGTLDCSGRLMWITLISHSHNGMLVLLPVWNLPEPTGWREALWEQSFLLMTHWLQWSQPWTAWSEIHYTNQYTAWLPA